jgi:hypothetical protein
MGRSVTLVVWQKSPQICPKFDTFSEFMHPIKIGLVLFSARLVQESSSKMRSHFETLPVLIKLSALSVGTPLVLLGLVLIASDMAQIIRLHSFSAAPHFGLAIGPIFALVGASFLWPLRSFHQ